jgi:hypothetical protein
MRVTVDTEGIPNLPAADLMRVVSACVQCKTDTVFLAFTTRDFREHVEAFHPGAVAKVAS